MSAAAAVPSTASPAPRAGLFPLASAVLLFGCFCWCVFKAATASFTVDESYTFLTWVDAPWYAFFSRIDSNNHPLNTILCRLSYALFGPAELSLRLPNLLASLLYFYSVYRTAQLLLGRTAWSLLAIALACANPLVLDHFAVARGYGLGLAFWTAGFFLIADRLHRRVPLGFLPGLALGLSSVAYLCQAYPVAALALVAAALSTSVPRRTLVPFAIPIALAGAFAAWFASHVPLEPFLGERTFRRGVIAFLNAALNYRQMPWAKDLLYDLLYRATWPLLMVFLVVLLLTVLFLLRRAGKLDLTDRNLLLAGGTLILMGILLFAEPRLRHHVFFSGRRLLCTWPPLVFGIAMWFSWIAGKRRIGSVVSATGLVLLSLLAVHAATQFRPRTYFQWDFDAGAKTMAAILKEHPSPSGNATLATSGLLNQTMHYYQVRHGLEWIAKISPELTCPHDYWVVRGEDWPALARFDPVPLYTDAAAGTRLAATGPRYRAGVKAIRDTGFTRELGCTAAPALQRSATAMQQPGVNEHFLADVGIGPEDAPQTWTFERPAFLFRAPSADVRLSLHIRLALVTFQVTGPVTMTVYVNGHRLAEERYTTPEDHVFEKDVPSEWLRPDGATIVETTMDRYWIAPDDHAKLGYLFIAGGLRGR